MKKPLILTLLLTFLTLSAFAVEPLHVEGRHLVGPDGQNVQLRGVSFGWHMRYAQYFNESVVRELTHGWGADIVRCSVGTNLDDNGFEVNPELGFAVVDSVVSAAKNCDCYVLIDFHSHPNNLPVAKQFFKRISEKYGDCPNILYELWNEPLEVEWAETKAYAEELIPLIRRSAPHAVIVVPTPRWDQDIHLAADDPITAYSNLLYSVHFYAATHKDYLRERTQYALDKGLPVIYSECAAMVHTGDDELDMTSWEEWLKLADANGISWLAWSLSDKVETCSMLTPGTPADAGQWTEANLKPWAVLVRHYLAVARNKK